MAAIQAHLWPEMPQSAREDPPAGGRTGHEGGAGGRASVDAQELATAHPSVLAARSTSKGSRRDALRGDGRRAALARRWLGEQGLDAAAPSSPPDGSAAHDARRGGGRVQARRCGAAASVLADGHAFLRGAAGDIEAAAGGGGARRHGAAAAVLLARDPTLARRPAVGRPGGALALAASGGHVSVLRELLRRGAAAADGGAAALQAAVGGRHADAASLLHDYQHAAVTLTLGDATALPAAALAARRRAAAAALGAGTRCQAVVASVADRRRRRPFARDARRAARPRGRTAPLD